RPTRPSASGSTRVGPVVDASAVSRRTPRARISDFRAAPAATEAPGEEGSLRWGFPYPGRWNARGLGDRVGAEGSAALFRGRRIPRRHPVAGEATTKASEMRKTFPDFRKDFPTAK